MKQLEEQEIRNITGDKSNLLYTLQTSDEFSRPIDFSNGAIYGLGATLQQYIYSTYDSESGESPFLAYDLAQDELNETSKSLSGIDEIKVYGAVNIGIVLELSDFKKGFRVTLVIPVRKFNTWTDDELTLLIKDGESILKFKLWKFQILQSLLKDTTL